ncbi:MAG TPA: trypsin-like peptidase domain-containing protein [Candidatus Binatia bacterium]|nr:trypsin-like peptidase domain-containing protein [Candidatus Binatia bacterium]
MKKTTLYSSSRPSVSAGLPAGVPRGDQQKPSTGAPAAKARLWSRLRAWSSRYERPLWVAGAGLLALLVVFTHAWLNPTPHQVTQQDIQAAVLHTLETNALPSAAAKAYEAIRPSVVRVRRMEADKTGNEEIERGVGTGVVIIDKGVILTNLHVVLGAKRVQVVFADGLEADATIVGMQPEHDLAVLQAQKIPDDLVAATMRSTADLALGDQVVAVGFPFGIGPSATAGIVSGLRREFVSPEGKRLLTNLIQFDAAANPGSSGGPLVTAQGEVIGIVTAILNPTDQRFFVGIGFAVPIESAASGAGLPPF